MSKKDDAERARLIAEIRAYFARSAVLDPCDVAWGFSGSSGRQGRRYYREVHLTHVPTAVDVRVGSARPGGRTRSQQKRDFAAYYLEALPELERRVREKRRADRRLQFAGPTLARRFK
jgi:hypothetical protein